MSALSLPWLDVPGQPNNINHVMQNDAALRDKINGNLNGDNLATDVVNAWRTIATVRGPLLPAAVNRGSFRALDSAYVDMSAGGAMASGLSLIPITAADYAVAGRTTQLRVTVAFAVNATAPANTITAALYLPSAYAGGVGALTVTLPAGITGNGAAIVAPGASASGKVNGTAFTIPADGVYVLGVGLSAAGAANSLVAVEIALQLRHN